jgi:Rrf2 family nitric oxide-sensitive transcriptional repressor
MHVTRFTDIGMRALMYLLQERADQPLVTVLEIATQFDIPANHVVKVVGRLVKMGVIDATRGRHGGVRLSPSARGTGVGQLLRQLEGDDALIDCDGLACRLRGGCVLRAALQEGLEAFYQAMDRYTLADLLGGSTGEQVIRMHKRFIAMRASEAALS